MLSNLDNFGLYGSKTVIQLRNIIKVQKFTHDTLQ